MATPPPPLEPTVPTHTEVAALLRSRTLDQYGNELEDFTTDTTPTAAQADSLINIAKVIVESQLGVIPNQAIADQAKPAIMLLSAQLIETTYFPEEANQTESAANLYGQMYRDSIQSLGMAIRDNQPGTRHGFMVSIPIYGINGGATTDLPINWQQLDLDERWALEGIGMIPPRADEAYLDTLWESGGIMNPDEVL